MNCEKKVGSDITEERTTIVRTEFLDNNYFLYNAFAFTNSANKEDIPFDNSARDLCKLRKRKSKQSTTLTTILQSDSRNHQTITGIKLSKGCYTWSDHDVTLASPSWLFQKIHSHQTTENQTVRFELFRLGEIRAYAYQTTFSKDRSNIVSLIRIIKLERRDHINIWRQISTSELVRCTDMIKRCGESEKFPDMLPGAMMDPTTVFIGAKINLSPWMINKWCWWQMTASPNPVLTF